MPAAAEPQPLPSDMATKDPHGDSRDDSSDGPSSLEEKPDTSDIVDFDGPQDPANPQNWSNFKKTMHVVLVSLFTLNVNLGATMFAPGASQLAREFHVTDTTVIAMTVSLYVLGFGFGPLVLAPTSEVYGRLPVYYISTILFIAFTFGCAFSTNVGMFLAFRLLAGCTASGPMTVGGGTVADITSPQQRGKAMALFTTGPLLGPSMGPIIGGFVTENIGWRWTFRLILLLAGTIGILFIIFVRETSAAILLQRKAERLRRETGNENLRAKYDRHQTAGQIFAHAIVRPLRMIVLSPIVLLISLYGGVVFGLIFLLFTTFPQVFEGTYGFSAGISGLAYLGIGIGCLCGLVIFATLSDKLLKSKGEAKPRPEGRLILMKWIGPITPIGMFIYGWTAEKHVHWIVPIIGTLLVGMGALFIIIPSQAYLVDAYGSQGAASALAANLLVRAPFGAFLDLTAQPLYSRLGLGWGNSVLAFIVLAFSPVPWLFHRYGEALRTKFPVN